MSTITTIASGDLITNSRDVINNNFSALNTDKIETSVLDTDTTLSASSDTKVATQRAVKLYIDAGGSTEVPANFVSTSAGVADAGKGIKLNAKGSLNKSIIECYGDGSDGNVTISSPTTLTRNMYYDNLTVNSTLTTNGYQIFVKNTISGTGTVDWGVANNGASASHAEASPGGVGGAQSGAGPLKNTAGVNGGAGVTTSTAVGNNSNGVALAPVLGSAGANGGAGGAGDLAGGTAVGGTAVIYRKVAIVLSELLMCLSPDVNGLLVVPRAQGQSAGGGSGGGNTGGGSSGTPVFTGAGGGSGASGGIVWISARIWAGTFIIKSVGGNGGNGGNTGLAGGTIEQGGGGTGAGGNGGVSIVIFDTKTWTGTYNLAGGTAGPTGGVATRGSNGLVGSAGTTGTSFEIN